VGAAGRSVPDGEVGELWVRGPNVMKGYYRDEAQTAAAIDGEGWFNTRDLARLESDHLFIAGRTQELIIRFGFNVYPPEVEAVLKLHAAVQRAAVVGRQTADGTEEIVAFVEATPGATASTSELFDHAAQHLTPYKRPSEIRWLATMPMTSGGKILKRELTAMAASARPDEPGRPS